MINRKNIVAVIPARGGSKTLPDKNIRKLLGKPLIYYTIKAALKSKLVDKVIVSTDSEKIRKIARKYGAEAPFKRPARLATDTAHTPLVIQQAIKFLEKNKNYHPTIVVTLQPTSPIRKDGDIDKMIDMLVKNKYDSVVSVKDICAYHPWWTMKIKNNKLTPFLKLNVDSYNLERQQLPKVFFPNGSIYITKTRALFEKNNLIIVQNCGAYIMDEIYSLDIDNYLDFLFVKEVMKRSNQRDIIK